MRDFMVSHANVPRGARLWTFGTPRRADLDGFRAERGEIVAGAGFATLRPDADTVTLASPPDQVIRPQAIDRLLLRFDGVAPAYVVSRRQFVGYWEYLLDEAIYTAPVTVNWQGAALLGRDGKLLGIGSLAVNDAVDAHSQVPGNMFVPIDLLKPLLPELVAQGRSAARPRPWLGVHTQDVHGNVIVTRVSPGSPAENAALRTGDVIVGMGGLPVKGQAALYSRLWSSGEAGVDVALDVLRDGRIQPVTVKSIAREAYYRRKPSY